MTDSILYEAQPIPPEDPQDRQRQRRMAIAGGIALIVVLIAGVALGASLFRGGDDDPLAETTPTSTSRDADLTTTTVATDAPFYTGGQRSESSTDDRGAATRPGRPGGDVGTPTPPLPQQEFTWDQISLDLPAGQESYLQGVYAIDGGFLAIGMTWSEFGGQQLTVWRSPDGISWEPGALSGDFDDASIWNIRINEHGGIALGESYPDTDPQEGEAGLRHYQPERVVWTSVDGVNWTRAELDFTTAPNESVWINTGVAGPNGFVVIGNREISPEFEPISFEKDGYTVRLSEYTYTYEVLDSSGTVIVEGSMDDFYGSDQREGQVVTDPATGEVLTVIPWDVWEQAWEDAYGDASGGPFSGFDYDPPVVTIEHDGYRVTVNEEDFTYTLEDAATGELIASGNADSLWRGPPPVIVDDAGNEVLRISWEEFDAAQEAHWRSVEQDYEYHSEMVVAASPNGIDWTLTTVETDSNEVSFESVVVVDGTYLAYGSQYDEYTGGPAIWSSSDGITWQHVADMPGGMWIWNLQQAPDGTLLAIGDGPQGGALWSSTDGIAWGEAFGTRIPEDRTTWEYMNQFGTGELGTVVIGSREPSQYGEEIYAEPLRLSRNGYTLSFDDYEWPPRVRIVNEATGETVLDVRLDEGDGLPEGFSYADGVTTITVDGVAVMSITNEEWDAAQQERWMELERSYAFEQPSPTMYFSSDLEEWVEVPVEFQGWISHVAVGSDAVVLAGEEYYPAEPYLEGEFDEELGYAPPTPTLFVGRPAS